MSKEILKIVAFWTAWILVEVLGIAVTTAVVYLFLNYTGLYYFGQMVAFKIGLALVECSVLGLIGTRLSGMIQED